VQAGILETLRQKCEERQMALVFVTHDLAVARQLCDDILVMYGGREMELGPVDDVFADPRNAYTLSLLGAVPELSGPRRALVTIPGELPSGRSAADGCPFAARCQMADPSCLQTLPVPLDVGPRHRAACVHASDGLSHGAVLGALVVADEPQPRPARSVGLAVEEARER